MTSVGDYDFFYAMIFFLYFFMHKNDMLVKLQSNQKVRKNRIKGCLSYRKK